MSEIHYVTEEGLAKLKEELASLESQRPIISKQIEEARAQGDISENAEYDAAKEAQGLLELKISKLQNTIANARVIDESKVTTDSVQMLTKVKMKNHTNGKVMEYTIVGESEANIREGRMAVSTPIAKALLGKSVGDIVDVQVPSGMMKLEILSISL